MRPLLGLAKDVNATRRAEAAMHMAAAVGNRRVVTELPGDANRFARESKSDRGIARRNVLAESTPAARAWSTARRQPV